MVTLESTLSAAKPAGPLIRIMPAPVSSTELPQDKPLARILVVDDDKLVRAFLTRFLERKGYAVTAAESGEDALALWKEMVLPPQLLIADLNMPGMGGKEIAAMLKRLQPGLKIIFISGSGSDLMQEAVSAVRDSHQLFKPFRVDQLTATIENTLAEP